MRQINVRFVVILLLTAVLGGAGVIALNRWQVSRNAGGLRARAERAIEEGDKAQGLQLLSRYVGMRPNDVEAYALFSKLLLEVAQQPGAGRSIVQQAYGVLENAVRKSPDDLLLRQRLAEFQIGIGRPGDAREHLLFLRERVDDDVVDGKRSSEPSAIRDQTARPPSPEGVSDDETLLSKSGVDMLLARTLMATGRFDEAADVLAALVGYDRSTKAFLEDRPPSSKETDAYVFLAAILDEELRATPEAEAVLSEATRVNTDDPRAWLAKRSWHLNHGDASAAEQDLAKAIEVAPDDLETLMASFDVNLRKRAFTDAQRAVTRANELFPDEERVVRAEALLALQQGERQRAIDVLEAGVEKAPEQPTLLLMLADTLLQDARVDEADEAIAKVAAIVGDTNPVAGLLRARVLMARQKWLEAQKFLEELRPRAVSAPDATRQIDLYLGQCFERLGQFDQQLEANQRVLSDDPNSVAARIGAASALAATGRREQALIEYEVIANAMAAEDISAFPQLWNPLLQLRIEEQLRQPDESRDWTKVDRLVDQLGASPRINDAQIAILRADVMVRKEAPVEALSLLREALGRDPANEALLGAAATLALRYEDQPSAKMLLEAAPLEARGKATVMLLEAKVAASDSKEAGATTLAELEQRATALEKDARLQVLNGLAIAYLDLGMNEEAERLWRNALKDDADNLTAWNALFRLAESTSNTDLAAEAAAEISRLTGPESAEARVSQAAVALMEVRSAAQARITEGIEAPLDDAARASLQEARRLLIEAENQRQNWAEIQLRFADLAMLDRDLDAAIERLKQAVRLTPGNAFIMRRLVSLLHSSGRIEEAQKAMELLRPEEAGGLDRITADLQLRSGNVDEALATAERALNEESTNADDLIWLGQLLARSGKMPRAIEVFQRVVEIDPLRSNAWLALVSLQKETEQTAAARATLEEAAETLTSPEKELLTAQGMEILGDLQDAEARFRDATNNTDGFFRAAQGLTSFLLRRGRLKEAQDELREIVAADVRFRKDFEVKVWARRLLAEMLAERGSYRDLQDAIAMIAMNINDGGDLSVTDLALQAQLLASRVEPESWRQALTRIDMLASRQPLTVEQRLVRAQLLDRLGQWNEARDAYISLLGTSDPPPLVYAALIERLISHDELSLASVWLERLRKKVPDASITVALTAKLAIAQDDRSTAVEAAKRLMPTETVPEDQLGQLGNTAILMEDLGFSKAADQLWNDYASRSIDGVVGRAEFLGREGQVSTALDLLDKVWDQIPLERLLQAGIGIARHEGSTQSPETSTRLTEWFSKARRLDPDSVTISLLEAELRDIQGRPADVEETYRNLLSRDDISDIQKAIIANNLAFHLARPETADEAERLVNEALQILGPHPDILDTRGLVELAKGNLEQAISDLEEAVLSPTAAKYLHLAEAQLAAKQTSAARRSLEEARSLGLDSDNLSQADRARLEKVEAAVSLPVGA